MNEREVQIQAAWLRLKMPYLRIDDQDISIGGPILDHVIKLDIPELSAWVKLWVESLISFDGISLRKLDLWGVRNFVTFRWTGKVSLKARSSTAQKVSAEAIDLILKTTGSSFLQPLYRLARLTRSKVMKNAPVDSRVFKWDMNIKDKWPVWNIWVKISKFHSLQHVPPEFQDVQDIQGFPAVHISTEVNLAGENVGTMHLRNNIPLFGLSRDHAKDVIITTHTSVSRILGNSIEMPLFDWSSQLHVGKFIYHTVQSSSSE